MKNEAESRLNILKKKSIITLQEVKSMIKGVNVNQVYVKDAHGRVFPE